MSPVSIHSLLAAVEKHLRIRLGVSFALAVGAVVGATLAVAWLLAGPAGWRPGTPLPLVLVGSGAMALVALAGCVAWCLRRWTAEPSLAGEIERVTSLPEGAVRAQAELSRAVPPGVSAALVRAGESALLERIRGELDSLAGAPGRRAAQFIRVSGAGLAVTLVIVMALFLVAPDRALSAWAGLASPAELLVRPPMPPLELLPGDAELPRGEEPLVEVVAAGRDSVTVHWRAIGEVEESVSLAVTEGRATVRLSPLETEVGYRASSPDGARTETHVLTPVDPSLLADLVVEATYPAHTRLPPESFRGAPEALAVPEGTRLRFAGGVHGEGVSVLLRDPSGRELARLPVADGRFDGTLWATRSSVVEWVVEGGQEGGLLPPPLELEVIPDAAPRLTFPEPGTSGELALSLRVPLMLDAVDDYGVAWVEIETHLRDENGLEAPNGGMDRFPTGDRTSVVLRPTLDFNQWDILPGEQVSIQARAADNSPTPHVVESAIYVLRMPRESELREIARDRMSEVATRTAELLGRAQQDEQELRDLERRALLGQNQRGGASADQRTFEERQEVQQALERQAELAREVGELQERLAEAARSLPDQQQSDLELTSRIEELERLLEEVLDPVAREQLEQLIERFESGQPTEGLAETAAELAQRQEEMNQRLEQMLETLRRSVLEESMRGAEEELRSLADTQDALVDSLRTGQGAEQQRDVEQRTQGLEQRMDQIADDLRAQAEPEAADQTDQVRAEMERARAAMQRGMQQSAQGNQQGASQPASDAAQTLDEALEMFQQAQAEMEQAGQEAMRQGLEQGAQDALALARRQAELRSELPGADPERRNDLAAQEAAIRDGLRSLAEALSEATSQAPDVNREASESVARAMASAQQAVDALQETGQRAEQRAKQATEDAQRAMNGIALVAMSGLGSPGESGQTGAAMNQMQAELDALAAAQSALNRGSQALGENPGPNGAAQLEQLAAAQAGISGQLGELSQRPGPGPGSLDDLSEEARRIAEEMAGGRLEATTLDRQSRFLDLLLSAGRSIERDEPTEERESRRTTVMERALVSPIPEYLLEARAVPLPSAEELEALSPAQRRLVLEYLERINGRRARGDGAP